MTPGRSSARSLAARARISRRLVRGAEPDWRRVASEPSSERHVVGLRLDPADYFLDDTLRGSTGAVPASAEAHRRLIARS